MLYIFHILNWEWFVWNIYHCSSVVGKSRRKNKESLNRKCDFVGKAKIMSKKMILINIGTRGGRIQLISGEWKLETRQYKITTSALPAACMEETSKGRIFYHKNSLEFFVFSFYIIKYFRILYTFSTQTLLASQVPINFTISIQNIHILKIFNKISIITFLRWL